jgi:hypothetical protein
MYILLRVGFLTYFMIFALEKEINSFPVLEILFRAAGTVTSLGKPQLADPPKASIFSVGVKGN